MRAWDKLKSNNRARGFVARQSPRCACPAEARICVCFCAIGVGGKVHHMTEIAETSVAASSATGQKTIAVIDGNSLMHRAYHAVPPTMNAPDGTPTNAVFGFMSMLLKFIEVSHPDGIVCAFDAGKPQFRIEALKQYKAQRPPMDDELRAQFPVIENLLGAMNIPVVKVKGWEGDDILGTIAARDEARGYRTLLVTGDKDACQLASELTHIVNTKKGISDVAIYDPAAVYEKYGVTPEQIPDYLGLMGDASDNIPGVPGVGAKTATKFLQAYGSMEGLYDNLDKLKGKQLENVRDNRDLAFLSRQIATIVRDLDFPLDVDAVKFPDFDAQQVADAFHAIRFNAHLDRLYKVTGSLGAPDAVAGEALQERPVVEGEEAFGLLKSAMGAGRRLGVAFAEPEQSSLFADDIALAVAPACAGEDDSLSKIAMFRGDDAREVFARIVREGCFAALDVKAALQQVFSKDSSLGAMVDEPVLMAATRRDNQVADAPVRAFDLGLAAYVLNSSTGKYTIDVLADSYLCVALPETKDAAERAAIEAHAAADLVSPLAEALAGDSTADVFYDIDSPLVATLAIMERCGMPIDKARLAELGADAQVEIDQLRQRIWGLAGEEFNVDSPKQLSHVLFEVMELPHGKKTRSGYSTDAKVLGKLAADHEIAACVLKYREYAKIKSTYIDALPRLAAEYGDGRVHTTFNETVTTTGRLSSSDPNLQNIPVRTEYGRKIRSCFGAINPGDVFVSADYSQIELRLLAHLSQDAGLIDAFKSGEDFHAETAARVFGVDVSTVTPQMRSRAKAVNFGIVYGQQAFGLGQSLGISLAEAQGFIDRYYAAYPRVRTYLDETVEHAREAGFAETMFGRKRHIPELAAKNKMQRSFGERTAMNHPMQGSAADIIKLAMTEVERRLVADGFAAKLMVQVHDELDFSCPADEVSALTAMVKDVMENVVSLRVPLIADVSSAATWAEAH